MVVHVSYDLSSVSETEAFAQRLARYVFSPLTLIFRGDLGAGKTTLIRAMLRAFHVTGSIRSPTFSLVESYFLPTTHMQLHHFDLYRIEDESELEYIGFREYFSHEAICCIEWPERAVQTLKSIDVDFLLKTTRGHGRILEVYAKSPAGEKLLSCLAEAS